MVGCYYMIFFPIGIDCIVLILVSMVGLYVILSSLFGGWCFLLLVSIHI